MQYIDITLGRLASTMTIPCTISLSAVAVERCVTVCAPFTNIQVDQGHRKIYPLIFFKWHPLIGAELADSDLWRTDTL